jgi:hypothetical protein
MLAFPQRKIVNNTKDRKASICAGIKSMKVAQDLHLDLPRQDLITNIQYSDRILDALARIFHGVSLPCTAVCMVEDTLYVAYSVTGKNIATVYPPAIKKAQKIYESLKITIDNNNTYIAFRDWLLKEGHKFYLNDEVFENAKESYISAVANLLTLDCYKNLRQQITEFFNLEQNNLAKVDDDYNIIINSLAQYNLGNETLAPLRSILDSAKSKMVYLNNRIDQDCYKVVKYYSEYGIDHLKLEFIENLDNLHAELLLRQTYGVRSGYIGISKLSCFFCDIFLRHEEELYGCKLHLGGHGIAFPMQNNDLPEMLFDEERKPVISKMFLQVSRAYECTESLCYSVDNAMQYPPLSPRNEGLHDPWDPNVPVVAEDYSLTALGDNAEANCIIY